MTKKIVCVSGGFDPVHIGHLRMMQAASKYGKVIAIVNSDEWLMRKKGYIFMPFEQRCEILRGLSSVSDTTYVDDTDNTACEALLRIQPNYFANGGDRKNTNIPEMKVCEKYNIELLWNMGGGKIQSSSELISSSPMLASPTTNFEGVDLNPSRVEIVQGDNVPKK